MPMRSVGPSEIIEFPIPPELRNFIAGRSESLEKRAHGHSSSVTARPNIIRSRRIHRALL